MGSKLEDIARLAGVNPSTVSRTINKPEKVKLKTRQKIEAIINETGYKPNFFAQGLMKGQTDSVGIITSSLSNPYFIEIIETMEHLLTPDGTYTYLCNCENNIKLEKKYLDELIRRKIDALFVLETPSLNTENNLYTKSSFDCPVILINQHVKPYGDNIVIRCDQEPGITEVFDEVERRRLYPFVLLIPMEISYSYILKERLFENWRRKNHLNDKQVRCVKLDNLLEPNNEESVWSSYEAAKELFPRFCPRSILAGNDLIAMGVLSAAREAVIAVPEDLSIAGVDNTIFSRISVPALSTIDLKMGEIGTMAAETYQVVKNEPPAAYEQTYTIPSLFCRRGTF
ncbi:MAG: LacI family transcriptional regulator [Treponema sp.]|jgi:DNA-binding LacI/PurR family transcriptional regulator|nr:LacI family transcriptional regulator [Treponema sp.]